MRNAGILMPVSALPSPNFVGDFGKAAYQFVDKIKKAGFSIWQVLPLNPLGYGNSPYQPYSSKALEEGYASIEMLQRDGLVKNTYPKVSMDKADFQAAREIKRYALKEAYSNFTPDDDYREFVRQTWVVKYAIFISFKEKFDLKCWNDWPVAYRDFPLTGDENLMNEIYDDVKFQMFVQYILFKQFRELKKYANENGISIMGDIPFYVGIDSDDVYFNRQYFMLDDDGRPLWIAGVPPDYFSKTGQRWGNPLYNWELLRKENYSYWFDRLAYNQALYDTLRIDHFRAFDTYWKIPAYEETAMNGTWIVNTGHDFFTKLFAKYPDMDIIAEDLGSLRPEVLQLRDDFNLKGMKVLEFSFFEESKVHEISYVGTHDNASLREWYRVQKPKDKQLMKLFISQAYPNETLFDGILHYTFDLKSENVIISICDVLLEMRHINTPGTVGSPNWEYKLTGFAELDRRLPVMSRLIRQSGRAPL